MKRGDIIDYDTDEGVIPAFVLGTNDESDNATVLIPSYEGYWRPASVPLDYQTNEQKSDAEKKRESDEADAQRQRDEAAAAQSQQNQDGRSAVDIQNDNTVNTPGNGNDAVTGNTSSNVGTNSNTNPGV